MPCSSVKLPGGGAAIVCTSGRRQRCACGRPAARFCDWKVPKRKSGTCDRAICERCTYEPAPDKDLCPAHAAEWKARSTAPKHPQGT